MLLSPALLLCSLTGWAAGQTQPVNEIWYTSSDNSVITPTNCGSIISNAFDESKGMYVITFADTVTSIGNCAFMGCSSLTAVTIPNSVVSIGNYAFMSCSSLTAVTIPNSVVSIGDYAFQGCSSLTAVTIPNSVVSIGNYAFQGCSSLTAVTIPNSVESIGNGAFMSCSSLTAVTIPNSVESIGNYAFQGCSSLTAVTIPNSVVSIGNYAFQGCSSLTAVTIPNSVESIGNGAFYGCSSLTAVTFAEGSTLKSIGNDAFQGCSSLTAVTIPNSVVSIGDDAFHGCSSLTAVTIPNSVESIGEYAFSYCSSLTSITIPNSVESIGDDAFSYCYFNISNFVNESKLDAQSNNYWGAIIFDTETNDGLRITGSKVVGCRPNTSSITIPNSVESIGNYAFYGCTSLTAVTFAEGSTLKSIGEAAFYGCFSLTSIAIPDSVESIGNGAFYGCSSLTAVTFAEGSTLKSIGEGAFVSCSGLTSIAIPDSVESIGEAAFIGCSSLSSITIPNSVESIGNSAFANCCFAESSFINNSKLNAQANGYWGAVIIDTETNDGLCITDSMVVLCRPNATSVIIPSHIESIGEAAFYGCFSLTAVTFAEGSTLKSIGNYAFCGCVNLTSVNIPNSIESIGNYAFSSCFFAESSFINNSKLDARANGYWGAVIIDTETNDGLCITDNMVVLCRPNATSITIPNTITGIVSDAFLIDSRLETVFCLKATPPAIAGTVFKKCPNLSAIYVDASYIDDYKSAPGWSSYASIINEYNPEPFKNAALAEIRAAMQGETGSAYLNELVSVELTNIESATDGNTIETNKSAAIAKLNAVISAFQAGKAEAIGDFGTMTDGPAVRVTKGDRTIILYNPDRVDFIKITSEE